MNFHVEGQHIVITNSLIATPCDNNDGYDNNTNMERTSRSKLRMFITYTRTFAYKMFRPKWAVARQFTMSTYNKRNCIWILWIIPGDCQFRPKYFV